MPANSYFELINANIKAERTRARLTQKELAERLGITRSRLSSLECHPGQLGPSLLMLIRICEVLHVPLSRLLPPDYVP